MDEFAFWNVELDTNDINEIYNSVVNDDIVLDLTKNSGGYDKSGSLTDYFRFEGGTTVKNEGSRTTAATVNGATFITDDIPS